MRFRRLSSCALCSLETNIGARISSESFVIWISTLFLSVQGAVTFDALEPGMKEKERRKVIFKGQVHFLPPLFKSAGKCRKFSRLH